MNQQGILGISTVHIQVEEVKHLKLNRLEVCLGRAGSYEERLLKAEKEMAYAENNDIAYSVHLPLYLYDWYDGDYLDAFYLDKDPQKREMSFRLLEENLKLLGTSKAEYFVIHFPGVYLKPHMEKRSFETLLKQSLERVNQLAKSINKKLLLEYFGSNVLFSSYKEWTERLKSYSHLGILVDTGHLYYASLIHQFDFNDGFQHLIAHSDAFHIWTTKGDKPYSDNHFYKTYHHIAAHPEQQRENGWAFDTLQVFNDLIDTGKPIVIEASPIYEGPQYFYNSITALRNIASNTIK